MAVDTQYISDKDFNNKFKNYLRDFYTFQFKNKDMDFYDKGTFSGARMTAVCILSFISGCSLERLSQIEMQDLSFEDDYVSIRIEKEDSKDKKADSKNKKDGKDKDVITLERPLCEMFRYLYSADKKAFFLTGNTGTPNKERLQAEYDIFCKACPSPKTTEKMYRYWGQIYLDEANETISNSTYRNDSIRIQNIVQKMNSVTWKYGNMTDYANDCTSDEDDNRVECITVDTRTLKENPFHSLYQYCNRYYSNEDASCGEHFALIYALILYFNLGVKVYRTQDYGLTAVQINALNECLILLAENSENKSRRRSDASEWKRFSDEDKTLFAHIAIEQFMEAKGDVSEETTYNYESVYKYLIENKKRIVYSDNRFLIEDDTQTCIDVDRLYEFYDGFVNQQYSIQRRQFFNVVKSLVKIGLFEEKKELKLELKRKKAYPYSVSQQIKEILDELNCPDAELIEKVRQRVYILRYNSNTDEDAVGYIREEIKERCKGWECKASNRIYCQLSSACLSDILSGNTNLQKRFSDMLSFFSQTAPLGEVGRFISRCLPETELPVYFKHNYIIKALNDYNLIDLLYAVRHKKWIKIECRSPLGTHQYQKFVCFPLEIREDVANGEQQLLYYHPAYRSVSCVRVDFIDSIAVGENEEQLYFLEEDISRARKLIRYTWGNKFDGFFEGNVKADIKPSRVKFVVAFDKTAEPYISARLKKELSRGTIEEKEQNENIIHAEIVVDVVNPFDMLHWMRSYTKRIVSIEIEHTGFTDDIMRSYKMYQLPSRESISLKLSENPLEMLESFSDKFKPCDSLHDQLFNEFFNISCMKLGDILTDILQKRHIDAAFTASAKLGYLDAFIFDNSKKTEPVRLRREQQVDGFIRNFTVSNESIFAFSDNADVSSVRDLIPLTKIQLQWLADILKHPFAVSFLREDEIKAIENRLPAVDLFDINSVAMCNQAVDIREFYEQKAYAGNLRAIINAIRAEKRIDIIGVTQYGTPNNHYDFAPAYIEYSKRDNRFRIRGVNGKGRIVTINLERTKSIELSENSFEPDKIRNAVSEADAEKERHLNVIFYDINNIPEKILSEFSCYRKECVRQGNGKYRMRLYYNSDDYSEIVIRLLAYGSLVTVSEDNGDVLAEIKLRLEQQLELSKIINRTSDNAIKEADIEYEI